MYFDDCDIIPTLRENPMKTPDLETQAREFCDKRWPLNDNRPLARKIVAFANKVATTLVEEERRRIADDIEQRLFDTPFTMFGSVMRDYVIELRQEAK